MKEGTEKNAINYGINWSNVDLTSAYNRDQNLLEPYDFSTLLLEIECNLPGNKITEEEILNHAIEVITQKHDEALQILKDNLSNITKHAKQEHKNRTY